MTIGTWIAVGFGAIVAGLLGAILHEYTHAAVAKALGFDEVAVDVRKLVCRYSATGGDPRTRRRVRWVGVAPLLVGLVLSPILIWGAPAVLGDATVYAGLPLAFAWLFYTFGGGFNDLRITRSDHM